MRQPTSLLTLITTCLTLATLAPSPAEATCTGLAPAGTDTLRCVDEKKIAAMGVPRLTRGGGDYEASGVQLKDGELMVVFDNSLRMLTVDTALTQASLSAGCGSPSCDQKSQYEAITWDAQGADHFFVAIESAEKRDGSRTTNQAQVVAYGVDDLDDPEFTQWTDVTFDTASLGMEGLAWLWHCPAGDAKGDDYLLGLCQRKCSPGGDSSKGWVQVLKQRPHPWTSERHLKLPVAFSNYNDIALYPPFPQTCDCAATCPGGGANRGKYRVAVVSKDPGLWIGELDTTTWSFTSGKVYAFPEDTAGDTVYCNVEGVTFLSESRVAVVSDATDKNDAAPCRQKEQMIHIFDLPQG